MSNISDFDFFLPQDLIAFYPKEKREESKLLILGKNQQTPSHDVFFNIINYLNIGDTLVLNNTKVFKARLNAKKQSGGNLEILIIKKINKNRFKCLIKGVGSNININIKIEDCLEAKIIEKNQDIYLIEVFGDLSEVIDKFGKVPLPPYIKREEVKEDETRYQTVYAQNFDFASVAAPTAGFHFSHELLNNIKNKGINIAYVTLHVGPGTFMPVKTQNIQDHVMHKEELFLDQNTADLLNKTKQNNKKIICVGTTSLRLLESAIRISKNLGHDHFTPINTETDIFIKPGFEFLAANALITNFHLPKSTLFILVCAILGKERALNIYKEAIEKEYKFFSYGDACFFDIN